MQDLEILLNIQVFKNKWILLNLHKMILYKMISMNLYPMI